MMDYELLALSVIMLVVGGTVLWRQSKAGTCPNHSRVAGGMATVLGWGTVIAGIGVAVFAILLQRNG